MKKICKVQPYYAECMGCKDVKNIMNGCDECELKNAEYELISVGTTFFGRDYAFVQREGKIERVDLLRVYDIQYVDERYEKCSVPL